MIEYRICTRCVMDNSDPAVTFDEHGVCSVCKRWEEVRAQRGYREGVSEKELAHVLQRIREAGKGKEYDCVIGLSGGVDSAYMLVTAVKHGLRPYVVHVDSCWNTEVASQNIEKICGKLNIPLHTVSMDWPTMKELQRAYLLSGVANIDVAQDHLYCSVVFQIAKDHNISFILNGSNIATEGAAAPFSAQHTYRDAWHMKSIYRKHGRGYPLKKYPFLSLKEAWLGVSGVTKINLLDYLPYTQKGAIAELNRDFGWEYYGGKHFECTFTKYYQSVYLPTKFHYDKRRNHLSNLIMNGEITREEALAQLENPPYPVAQQQADEAYILERLEIDPELWQQILHAPPTPNSAYFSQQFLFDMAQRLLGKGGLDKAKKKIYSAK